MARLQEQSTYKPLEDTAFRIGQALPRKTAPQPAPQPAPPSSPISSDQYSNLRGAIKETVQMPKDISDFSNLGTITTPYGGSTRYEPGGKHFAVDIAAPEGTPIGARVGGIVKEVQRGSKWTPNTPSFGNFVLIETPTGETIRYSHLYEDFVKVGEQIERGRKIGTVGGTGSTYSQHHEGPGPHLDFRIRDAYGKYVNPNVYLANLK